MEKGPRFSFEADGGERHRIPEQPKNLREELTQMYLEAPSELAREIIGKLILMMDAKERAQKLAQYIATADPRDTSTYLPEKKLGILLVCDATSTKDYQVGDIVVHLGDRAIQLHLPPRTEPASGTTLLRDLTESLQLTSDYIDRHRLNPRYIYGCTYEPLVSLFEKRYGLAAVRINIPDELVEPARRVFHHFIDPNSEPTIGFIYTTLGKFQQRFPPRK